MNTNPIIKLLVDIASTPAILVSLIALLGLVLQKKGTADTIKGVVKTFIGFLVLSAGADVVSGSLSPFGAMFEHAFNVQGVVPNNEAVIAIALNDYGTDTAIIMFLGMVFNMVFARFTKFKHIFLTGHHTLYMACMIAVILAVPAIGFTGIPLYLVGGLILALVMSLSPYFLQPFMKKIAGTDSVGLGHFSGATYWLSAVVGKLVNPKGEKVTSTEDVNFPKSLAFLRDSTVSIALTMMVIYIIVALAAGPAWVEETYSGGVNAVIFAFTQGGKFAAGVYVILAGVRLILAEIVPAFKGISEKLVPNAIPALDCPVVFPYAPNAVLIGFFSSFLGGVVSMLIMGAMGTTIILPGVVPHFFVGATAGVFGNSTGGLKGALLGSFANGVAISFLPLWMMPLMGSLGNAGSTFSDADFTLVGLLFGNLGLSAGQIGVIGGVVVIVALMFAATFMGKSKNKA